MSTYSELLKDPRWQKKRLEILERDNWMCQHCRSTDKMLHVHHIKYSGFPWEAEDKFLITLCEECHELEESRRNLDWYGKIVDNGLTRADLNVLFEHVNYALTKGSFNSVLEAIVCYDDLKEFVKWRNQNG